MPDDDKIIKKLIEMQKNDRVPSYKWVVIWSRLRFWLNLSGTFYPISIV